MGKANIFNTDPWAELDPDEIVDKLIARADKADPAQMLEFGLECYAQALFDFEDYMACDEGPDRLIAVIQERMSRKAWNSLLELEAPKGQTP